MNKLGNTIIFFVLVLSAAIFAQQTQADKARNARLLQVARNYEQTSQFGRALELYERLWSEEPGNMTYYTGVKQNFVKLRNFTQALTTVNKMLKIHPGYRIEADQADVYFQMGEKEKAESLWSDIIKKNPDNRSVYQVVAGKYIANRMYDEAIQLYKQARARIDDKNLFLLEIANLHRAKMEHKQAVLLYLEYLKYNPKQYSYVEYNITSFANDEELVQEIEGILLEQIKKDEQNLELRNLLAALYMRTSNYSAALEEFSLIDQYVSSRPEKDMNKVGGELFQFAQSAFNDGAYQHAIQAYNVLLSRYPKSPYAANAKFGIANSYEKTGDFSRAVQGYKDIIKEYARTPFAKRSYFQIGEIQLDHFSNPEEAEKNFREVIQNPPLKPFSDEAMFRISDCYIRKGEIEKARAWNQDVINKFRSPLQVQQTAFYKLGQVEFWSGNFEGVLEQFKKIQNMPVLPSNDPTGIYVNDALEYMMFIEENKSNSNFLKLFAQAELSLEQKDYSKAKQLFLYISENDSAGNLQDDALLKMGDLEFELGNYQPALFSYQQFLEKFPDNYFCDAVQKKIGEVYEFGLKEPQKAQQSYETVLITYPDSIYLEEIRERIRLLDEKSN